MEEDIKIVKELLQGAKDNGMYDNNKYFCSIENLIKRYRELEEERNHYKGCFIVSMENSIQKSKIKEIIDECIPKGKNIMTGEEEYQPNTNANSFLTQSILELMEDK